MFGTASFLCRKSTDFILEGNYIVRYMTQYFKDIGPQIMPRESTHSGVKAWIWIQSQTGCFFDGIPAFLYHFYTFAATLLFWLTVWSGQFADGPNEGGGGGSSEPNSQVELQICSRKIPRGLLNLAISSGRISTCRVVWGDRKPNIRGLTMLYNIFFNAQVNRELHFILKFDHHDLRYFHWFQATEA